MFRLKPKKEVPSLDREVVYEDYCIYAREVMRIQPLSMEQWLLIREGDRKRAFF